MTTTHARESGQWVDVHRIVYFEQEGGGTQAFYYQHGSFVGSIANNGASGLSTSSIQVTVYRCSWAGLTTPGQEVTATNQTITSAVYCGPTVATVQNRTIPCTPADGFLLTVTKDSESFNRKDLFLPPITIYINRAAGTSRVDDPLFPDADGDGIPDSQDPDDDGDGIPDVNDPDHPDYVQPDTDGDGDSDIVDEDDDGDGIPDGQDPQPLTPGNNPDTDGDGQPDWTDPDDDGDGSPDTEDPAPLNPDEFPNPGTPSHDLDTDGDGVPDYIDSDDDNDGVSDPFDRYPKDPTNGGNGGGSGGGPGTPETPEPSPDGNTAGMNGLTEGNVSLPGTGKPAGDTGGAIGAARDALPDKIQGFRLFSNGAITRATSYTFTITVPRFGTTTRTIDFTAQPWPAIRMATLLMLTVMLGNSFLKRITI